MVMATYSPQHVGLEFVRQYYTVLNKDPTQLHRFYTKNSLFSHCGSQGSRTDEPIIGQEAIHSKICQLKFRDCRAKIISVDSHPTIGDGVVVQVTGLLSNDGLPMRRFMQTFVLAPQAPKKYCVFNDIFRYQDDEFDDDTECNEDSPESDTEVLPTTDPIVPPMNEAGAEEIVNSNPPAEYYHTTTEPFDDLEPNKGLINGEVSDNEDQPADFSYLQCAPLEEVVVKSTYESKEELGSPEDDMAHEFQATENETAIPVSEAEDSKEEDLQEEEPKVEGQLEREEEEAETPEEPSKPVSWAAMAKKNAPTSQAVAATRAPPKPQPAPVSAPAPLPQRGPPRRREDSKSEKGEGRRKFNAPPPDSNQIFIGNLPSGISEADVKNIFKEFGNVVEVRINPKNFGFVAFDNSEPVTEILKRPPVKAITFNGKVINIEEKRSGPTGGPRGGPKRDKDGGGRPKGDGYQRGGVSGGKGGQSSGRGGKGGQPGGSAGGANFQRQKSGNEVTKGEGNRGGRFRHPPPGGARR